MNKNILRFLSDYSLKPIGKDSPFNEIDGMVFAIFSYAPTGNEWPEHICNFRAEPLNKTMGGLSEALIDVKSNSLLSTRFGSSITGDFGQHFRFFKHIAKNPRYKDIKITGFRFSNIGYCQFCAFTFEIGNGEYVIAYRGTDGSPESWYESYKMFSSDILSHKLAKKHFQEQLAKSGGTYRLVGHSKGGNLAISAAVLSGTRQKLSIRSIINYDGPGFTMDFLYKHYKSILLIQHKTYRFSPEDALVSTLFFGDKVLYYRQNIKYIKSYGLQIPPSQHLYFNWSLNEFNKFDFAPQSKFSKYFQKYMRTLLLSHSCEEISNAFESAFALSFEMYAQTGYILTYLEIASIFVDIGIKLESAKRQSNSHCIQYVKAIN